MSRSFNELQPTQRRTNDYCAPIHSNRWDRSRSYNPDRDRLIQALQSTNQASFERHARQLDRRTSLNTAIWWRSSRIEVRLHSGTIQYQKLTRWAMLMLALVNRVKMVNMPEITPVFDYSQNSHVTTEYVCKQLGLLPSRAVPLVPQESLDLVAWVKARRQQFAGVNRNPEQRPTPTARPATPQQTYDPVIIPDVMDATLIGDALSQGRSGRVTSFTETRRAR